MSAAYVDSSVIVAIAFEERSWGEVDRQIGAFDNLWASNLLEAEVRAAYARTGIAFDVKVLSGMRWIIPDRPLTSEISMVTKTGYVKGADLWHLATALYMTPDPSQVAFITLDERQGEVARALGFRV